MYVFKHEYVRVVPFKSVGGGGGTEGFLKGGGAEF